MVNTTFIGQLPDQQIEFVIGTSVDSVVGREAIPGGMSGILSRLSADQSSISKLEAVILTPQMMREGVGSGVIEADTDAFKLAIDAAATTGRNVYVPAQQIAYEIGETLTLPSAVKIVGAGFARFINSPSNIHGSVLRRSGLYPIFSTPTNVRTAYSGVEGLYLDGRDIDSDVIVLSKVANFYCFDNLITGSGNKSALKIKDATYDSWFERNYFGPSKSGGALVEIDDSAGDDSDHNQNIRFLFNTWEAYQGHALKIFGKGVGPGNSLIQFICCKFEGLKSNLPHIIVEDSSMIDFYSCFIAGQGLSGSGLQASSMVNIKNSKQISAQFDISWLQGGIALENVLKLDTVRSTMIALRPASSSTIDNLSADSIVSAIGERNGTYVTSTYYGGKKLTSEDFVAYSRQQRPWLDCSGAIVQTLSRDGGSGNKNTTQQYLGKETVNNVEVDRSIFVGKDPNGNFGVGTSADLGGSALFRVSRDGKGIDFGPNKPSIYYGYGEPTSVSNVAIASIYLRLDGGSSSNPGYLYIKTAGSDAGGGFW